MRVVIEPGAVNGLVEAIFRLSKDAQLCKKLGRRARAMLDANFTRRQALQRWQSLLQDLDASRASVIDRRLTANFSTRSQLPERVLFRLHCFTGLRGTGSSVNKKRPRPSSMTRHVKRPVTNAPVSILIRLRRTSGHSCGE